MLIIVITLKLNHHYLEVSSDIYKPIFRCYYYIVDVSHVGVHIIHFKSLSSMYIYYWLPYAVNLAIFIMQSPTLFFDSETMIICKKLEKLYNI